MCVEIEFKRHWQHPITPEVGYDLFLWWVRRSDERLDVAAATLGVSTRTAQRWMQKRFVPHSIAVLIDQIKNGPAVTGNLSRGRGAMMRFDWRPYLRTKFKEYR
jgi:hypothetical protein